MSARHQEAQRIMQGSIGAELLCTAHPKPTLQHRSSKQHLWRIPNPLEQGEGYSSALQGCPALKDQSSTRLLEAPATLPLPNPTDVHWGCLSTPCSLKQKDDNAPSRARVCHIQTSGHAKGRFQDYTWVVLDGAVLSLSTQHPCHGPCVTGQTLAWPAQCTPPCTQGCPSRVMAGPKAITWVQGDASEHQHRMGQSLFAAAPAPALPRTLQQVISTGLTREKWPLSPALETRGWGSGSLTHAGTQKRETLTLGNS